MTIYRLHLVEWIFKAAKDNIILSQREGKIKKNPVTSIGFFFFLHQRPAHHRPWCKYCKNKYINTYMGNPSLHTYTYCIIK